MKKILYSKITKTVKNMCIEANCNLNHDIKNALHSATSKDTSPVARSILCNLCKNAEIASQKQMPICQDTGMAIFFVTIGQDVHIEGGLLADAIQEGVKAGYGEGYLRKSVVGDPLLRENTGDNTPAIIYYDIVEGDSLTIDFAPKGFGSENMSALKMLKPADGKEGVIDFVLDTVSKAGPNPCPPIVIGIGIGGSMEKAAIMAKQALLRDINSKNSNSFYNELEDLLLVKINKLGIGPQGLGGDTTAIGVNIETFPTHIAGLPVAVNISCHVTRHKRVQF